MRHPAVPQGIFKPKPTALETKQDVTSRAARQIIDSEAAIRELKTERLRSARLASEATNTNMPPLEKPAAKRKRH